MDSVPVFFCTDNEYAVPTYIAVYSLLKNRREDYSLEIFIMTGGDFSKSNTRLLKSLENKFASVNIHFINMAKSYESVTINNSRISRATLYRLMIPRIAKQYTEINMDKCIYLDSDLVVDGDIIDLYRIDAGDCYACGVRDRGVASMRFCDPSGMVEHCRMLGIPTLNDYINAGVLVLNLKAISLHGKDKELEECGYRNDFRFNDQDAINKVFFGGIKFLPPRYNLMTFQQYPEGQDLIDLYGSQSIKEARKKPLVVHFIAREKPWALTTMYMGDKWWKYVRMQDKEIKKEYILPFVKKHKLPVKTRLCEKVRTITKKAGVYDFVRKVYHRKDKH